MFFSLIAVTTADAVVESCAAYVHHTAVLWKGLTRHQSVFVPRVMRDSTQPGKKKPVQYLIDFFSMVAFQVQLQ